jgi:hypothetical protein
MTERYFKVDDVLQDGAGNTYTVLSYQISKFGTNNFRPTYTIRRHDGRVRTLEVELVQSLCTYCTENHHLNLSRQ